MRDDQLPEDDGLEEGGPPPHEVFISYSHHDKAVADATCAVLEANKIRCWVAPRDILPGKSWSASIIGAINTCKVVVLVWSSHSNESRQVINEIERAVSKGVSILPLRIEDVMPSEDLELFVSSCHWLDALTPPLERHLERLALDVAALLSPRKARSNETRPSPNLIAEPPFVHQISEANETPAASASPPVISREPIVAEYVSRVDGYVESVSFTPTDTYAKWSIVAVATSSILQLACAFYAFKESGGTDPVGGMALQRMGSLSWAVLLLSSIPFCMWFSQSLRNLRTLNVRGLKFAPGFAVGSFYIPVVSLVFPLIAMSDLWKGSSLDGDLTNPSSWKGSKLSAKPIAWMVSWSLFILLSLVSAANNNEADKGPLTFFGWASLCSVAAGACLIVLIIDITERQRVKDSRLSGIPPSVAPFYAKQPFLGPSLTAAVPLLLGLYFFAAGFGTSSSSLHTTSTDSGSNISTTGTSGADLTTTTSTTGTTGTADTGSSGPPSTTTSDPATTGQATPTAPSTNAGYASTTTGTTEPDWPTYNVPGTSFSVSMPDTPTANPDAPSGWSIYDLPETGINYRVGSYKTFGPATQEDLRNFAKVTAQSQGTIEGEVSDIHVGKLEGAQVYYIPTDYPQKDVRLTFFADSKYIAEFACFNPDKDDVDPGGARFIESIRSTEE